MKKPLIEVKELNLKFVSFEGIAHILDNVSFKIYGREIFGLVGETGCGKSVTALSIIRLLPKNSIIEGSIIFDEKNLLDFPEREMAKIRGRQISMILQDPTSSLNPMFKVGEQLCDAIKSNQPNRKDVKDYALELLKVLGFRESKRVFNSFPNELSGGMQQRIAIAIALSGEPKLLIADEPTTALDVLTQAQIVALLKDIRDKYGTSILLITHNLGLVAEVCDRVGVMYSGQIVETGPTEEIFYNTRHPYTLGLLQALPYNKPKDKPLPVILGNLPNPFNPPKGCRFKERCSRATKECENLKPKPYLISQEHSVACFNPLGDIIC
ncbi:MAG: ABC transporter ATP-binding protein [Nitrososphaeria archaeon]|nr:ABC transporter ATP-binding protein [Nitrososphaeria archaeon]